MSHGTNANMMMSTTDYASHAAAKLGVKIDRKAVLRACQSGLDGATQTASGRGGKLVWMIDPVRADTDLLRHMPRIRRKSKSASARANRQVKAATEVQHEQHAARPDDPHLSDPNVIEPIVAFAASHEIPPTLDEFLLDPEWHVQFLLAVAAAVRGEFHRNPTSRTRAARRRAWKAAMIVTADRDLRAFSQHRSNDEAAA